MARTEIEVAADTVLALLTAGVIATHQRSAAVSAAGLMVGDLDQAVQRRRARGFVAPRHEKTVKGEPEAHAPVMAFPATKRLPVRDVPEPRAGGNRGGGRPSRQPAPKAKTMQCGSCGESKSLDNFDLRADRPGVRWTVCNECRHRRHADRYLSVEKERALKAARIEFEVQAEDGLVGLICSDCGRALAVGDVVTGVAKITHARDCAQSQRKNS